MRIPVSLKASAWVLLCACEVLGQPQYFATTLTGGGAPVTPFPPLNAPATPTSFTVDTAGNPFFIYINCVYKLDRTGMVMLIAGTGISGFAGDGGPATKAQLDGPGGVAVDAAGNVYIADTLNGRIRKVDTNGIITTVAGNGNTSPTGDGGQATSAGIGEPGAVAVDSSGNLYFNDVYPRYESSTDLIFNTPPYDYVVRKVSTDGVIGTVAGIGGPACGDTGDGGPATMANLSTPSGIAVDASGNLYIADAYGGVRKVTSKGIITTIAGSNNCTNNAYQGSYSGDGGQATSATLWSPSSVAVDSAGNVYIADSGNNRVRKVTASTGIINTVAGNGTAGYTGDGGPAASAEIDLPGQVAVDSAGNLYILESWRIRKVTSPQGSIQTIASGNGTTYWGNGGLAANAYIGYPATMVTDNAGNLYIADSANHWIRELKADGTITTVAGTGKSGYAGDGGLANSAQLNKPSGVAVDSAGNVYIADTGNSVIRRITADGKIATFAGASTAGYSGDGGAAIGAQLRNPAGIAVDAGGNVYIADTGNSVIRRVTTDGKIATVAGTGTVGYSGDGGPATKATLNQPTALTLDAAGTLYIVDSGNLKVRKIGTNGNIGPATSAAIVLNGPEALAVDPAGNLYISDAPSYCVTLPCATANVYQISPNLGYALINANLFSAIGWVPFGVAADRAGNLFVGGQPFIIAAANRGSIDQFWGDQNFVWMIVPPTNPLVTAAVTHSGDFMAGQPDASYQVVLRNASAGSTQGQVTVTEIVPSGLTLVAMTGAGWTCSGNTCTRSDTLAGGLSYPPIAVTASVASSAAPQVVNQVTVSVAGSFTTSARDVTNVDPGPTIASVVNAATFQTGGIAPNEYITISGTNLGPATGVVGALSTALAETTVYVGGAQAMVTYTQNRQVNAILPWGIAETATTVQVEYNGVMGSPTSVPVAVSSPGIFTQNYGPGQAWVANQDQTFNSASNPAARGTYIAFWATGQGLVNLPQQDGIQPSGPPYPTPVASLSVSLGGVTVPAANLVFDGLLYSGEIQVNVLIPANAPTGPAVPLVLTIGGASSRSDATIAIK